MRKIAALYLASLIYALVRYVAFSPNNVEHLPLFISNKGVSMAAALCFVAGFRAQRRLAQGKSIGTEPAAWFRAGLCGAVAHIPMSLALLRPSYFEEFFAGEKLSFGGEAVILFGGLTAGGLFLTSRANWSPRQRWTASLVAMATLVGHTLCMGIARGLNMNRTYAYLPPMWLLSMIGAVAGSWFLLRSCPPSDKSESENDNRR